MKKLLLTFDVTDPAAPQLLAHKTHNLSAADLRTLADQIEQADLTSEVASRLASDSEKPLRKQVVVARAFRLLNEEEHWHFRDYLGGDFWRSDSVVRAHLEGVSTEEEAAEKLVAAFRRDEMHGTDAQQEIEAQINGPAVPDSPYLSWAKNRLQGS